MKATFLSKAVQAHHTVLNQAISTGKLAGLVNPVSMYASNGSVIVGPSKGVFGCGVSFVEDGDTTMAPPTLGSSASQHTLCWQISEGLYSNPEMVWVSGLQEPGFNDFMVVIGWLLYSGSSLTLSTSMLVSAPAASLARVLKQVDSIALYNDIAKLAGDDLKVTKRGLWTNVSSTSSIVKYVSLAYEVQADSSPATCIAVDIGLSAQAFFRSWLIREDGSTSLIQGGQVNGTLEASTQLLPLTQSKIQPWERFQVKFDLVLAPGASMDIGSIAITSEVITTQRAR